MTEDLISSHFPELQITLVSKNRLIICHPKNVNINLELRLPHDNVSAEGTMCWPGIKQSYTTISSGSMGEVKDDTRWLDDDITTPASITMKWEDWVLNCLHKLNQPVSGSSFS